MTGYKNDKVGVTADVEKGSVLNVPILTKSPRAYEMEAVRSIPMGDGEVFLCKIRNVLVDEVLYGEEMSHEGKVKAIKPAMTVGRTYFGLEIFCGLSYY